MAAGDFNHDGFADLAASAPDEAVGSIPDAGAVSILNGAAGGLTASGGRLFIQVGGAQAGDLLGFALALGDFDHDGFVDLAASAAGRDEFAGAVSVLQGAAGGLTTIGGQLFTQDSPRVPGVGEPYDHFGFSLTAGGLGTSPAASTTGANSTQQPTAPDG